MITKETGKISEKTKWISNHCNKNIIGIDDETKDETSEYSDNFGDDFIEEFN